jgi:hypothetical protein
MMSLQVRLQEVSSVTYMSQDRALYSDAGDLHADCMICDDLEIALGGPRKLIGHIELGEQSLYREQLYKSSSSRRRPPGDR